MTATIKYLPPAAGAFDPTDITLTDDTSGALLIKEGSNEYIRIDTTNSSEQIVLKGRPSSGNAKLVMSDQPYIQGADNQNIVMASTGIALNLPGAAGKRITNKLSHPTGFFSVLDSGNANILKVDEDSSATFTLDETSAAVFKVVDDAASPNTYLKAVEAGSVSTERNFEIYNSTAPSASVTDGCILFCEDVSSSSELKVRDEAGNVTTLSPHNFSLIPEGASEEMAWSYYSEKDGKKINVDMLRLARLVEQISGEQIIFEEG
jgi:hypothetical protein